MLLTYYPNLFVVLKIYSAKLLQPSILGQYLIKCKITMFTGIITDIGMLSRIKHDANQDMVLDVLCHYKEDSIGVGNSIAHNGVCLTVVELLPKQNNLTTYRCQLSAETLSCTTAKSWVVEQSINLELALKANDELGGHLVLGHVDAVTSIKSIEKIAESHVVTFELEESFASHIAKKGSVTIDGVSLTVNEVKDDQKQFSVMIVPHTWEHTIFQHYKIGQAINLEIDPISRYVTRYLRSSNN